MRCPNCGTENAASAAFCSRCGTALSTAAPPAASAPPPASAVPPAVPAPPPGPGQPGVPGSMPPGAPGGRRPLPAWALGALLGVGILAVGAIVWFAFLRGDDAGISAAPSASSSVGPDAVTGSSTGTTGPTGATETTTGTTGPTGETTAPPAFSILVEMCESVDESLNCVNGAPYEAATGWTIGQNYPTVWIKLTTENLQPGDVLSIAVVRQSNGEVMTDLVWDPAPDEVLEFEQWIYSVEPVTKNDPNLPWDAESFEFTISRNGEEISFSGPNVFTFPAS